MTVLTLTFTTLELTTLGPLLATCVALLARDPGRRTDACRVLRLLRTRTTNRRQRP